MTEDIGKDDLLILGKEGLLLVGPNLSALEPCVPPTQPIYNMTTIITHSFPLFVPNNAVALPSLIELWLLFLSLL
jgi:hypothetical protein